MVRLTAFYSFSIVAILPLALGKGLFETGDSSLVRRAGPTTGCTCAGFTFSLNSGPYMYVLASQGLTMNGIGANANGWCFQNGALIPAHAALITSAITSGVNTVYVNTTYAKAICSSNCFLCSTTRCADYIITQYTNAIFGQSTSLMAPCTFPTSNFIPTSCQCSFTCTQTGYVPCGAYCMNPATQSCVSSVPAPLRKRGLVGRGRFICPEHFTACPIPGGGTECVNTQSDLESCGGCVDPLGTNGPEFLGRDCTEIEGVNDVACVQGNCQVRRCARHYSLMDGTCLGADALGFGGV